MCGLTISLMGEMSGPTELNEVECCLNWSLLRRREVWGQKALYLTIVYSQVLERDLLRIVGHEGATALMLIHQCTARATLACHSKCIETHRDEGSRQNWRGKE